jgi:hypothetical protein
MYIVSSVRRPVGWSIFSACWDFWLCSGWSYISLWIFCTLKPQTLRSFRTIYMLSKFTFKIDELLTSIPESIGNCERDKRILACKIHNIHVQADHTNFETTVYSRIFWAKIMLSWLEYNHYTYILYNNCLCLSIVLVIWSDRTTNTPLTVMRVADTRLHNMTPVTH